MEGACSPVHCTSIATSVSFISSTFVFIVLNICVHAHVRPCYGVAYSVQWIKYIKSFRHFSSSTTGIQGTELRASGPLPELSHHLFALVLHHLS